ncbi:MAG: hypothetical protein P8181_05165 [bacterium]
METQHRPKKSRAGKKPRRTILFVDNDTYAEALRDAWFELRLADDFKVVSDGEEALAMLRNAAGNGTGSPIAAVVLDPDITGEDTGAFLRQVRSSIPGNHTPVVFWTWDTDKYRVLEGRGVDSVLEKPMFLRLIQTLVMSCHLRV